MTKLKNSIVKERLRYILGDKVMKKENKRCMYREKKKEKEQTVSM